MAVNVESLNVPAAGIRRPTDKPLYIAAAVLFPLVVLAGYFRSYYFSSFFDVPAIANSLVHAHGLVMTAWVIYFAAQIALIRTKNFKIHMTMGLVGIALAALVIVIGMATAYDSQLVRAAAPPGLNPHVFFFIPVSDMTLFAVFFSAAIYYRKRPAAHKSLMLLTAINFMPAALFRISPVPDQYTLLWAAGIPLVIAIISLAWHTTRHVKLNPQFAIGVLILAAMIPIRMFLPGTSAWLGFVSLIAPQ